MILTKSFTFSFKINKVHSFPALTEPFPLIFVLKFFIKFEPKYLINPGKCSPAKEITTFANALFTKLPR